MCPELRYAAKRLSLVQQGYSVSPLSLVLLQFDPQQKTALVMYPETNEEEWINLTELVRERCIAVGECCTGGTRSEALPACCWC